ncbi:MAG: terminase family protein [Candidatus Peribacteraceae bacterium]|nr:terminase family protein [Candidatus Peribacteraceae bacterium]
MYTANKYATYGELQHAISLDPSIRIDTWVAHKGPQTEVLSRGEREVLYGGARGGGKTEAGLAWLARPELIKNPKYSSLVLRRNESELGNWLERAVIFYEPFGVKISRKPGRIKWPAGGNTFLGHMGNREAVEKHLGNENQRILIEELTLIADLSLYERILGSCRSTLPGIPAQIFMTTNPGGVGHYWVKERFVSDSAGNNVARNEPFFDEYGNSRIFIPGHVFDNPSLSENDPDYVNFLRSISDENQRKAWLEGDWDVFDGKFFTGFGEASIIDELPDRNLNFYRAVDYAFADCCSCLWIAVDSEKNAYVYREMLESGLTMTQAAEKIKKMSPSSEEYIATIADPEMWTRKHEGVGKYGEGATMVSAFNYFQDGGIYLQKANNDRPQGWYNVKEYMAHTPGLSKPKLKILRSGCPELIKHIPMAVYSDTRAEDLDSRIRTKEKYGQYHWDDLDALRYVLMHIYESDDAPNSDGKQKYKDLVDKLLAPEDSKNNDVSFKDR